MRSINWKIKALIGQNIRLNGITLGCGPHNLCSIFENRLGDFKSDGGKVPFKLWLRGLEVYKILLAIWIRGIGRISTESQGRYDGTFGNTRAE